MAICETCGLSFEPKQPDRANRFCSGVCYYTRGPDGPRKASVKRPRQTTAKGHPLADDSGRVAVSRLTLYGEIGPGPHRCHWCGVEVVWMRGIAPNALIADHLDWDEQNNDPANLVASCHSCNARRARPGRRSGIQPHEPTLQVGKYRTRAEIRTCPTCGKDFLTLPSRPRTYCSRRCSASR
jgi:endogenous inhibitor of DNA gyrase (YacG/DUF329 family)